MSFSECNPFKLLNEKLLTQSMVLKTTHFTVRQELKRKIKFTLFTFVNFSINEKLVHKHKFVFMVCRKSLLRIYHVSEIRALTLELVSFVITLLD